MNRMVKYLLSLPKTIYVNFKVFSFADAIKLPVTVSYNTTIRRIEKGCIQFGGPI